MENKLIVGSEGWPLEEVIMKTLKRSETFGLDEETRIRVNAACLMIYVDGISDGIERERAKGQGIREAAAPMAGELPSKGKA